MPANTYVPNLASLDAGFPRGMPAPALLRAFGVWLATQPRSSAGWFHLESDPVPPAWTADDDAAAVLRDHVATFLKLPSGGRLALWNRLPETLAVVLLLPSREVREVAPDLGTFLIALAHAATGVADLDRGPSPRAGLVQWLHEQAVTASDAQLAPGAFARWFDATLGARRSAIGRSSSLPLTAAPLPPDLFDRIDPLLGLLVDDDRVTRFFHRLGIDLDAIRSPDALRFLARANDGIAFSIAWPWDLPTEWADREFPRDQRAELERRRARMLWSLEYFVAPNAHGLEPFRGALPFDLDARDDVEALERKLGRPILGKYGSRTWDFPGRRRSLSATLNEGAVVRPELPRGALISLRWQRRQSA